MDTKNKTYDHNINDCETYQPIDLNKVSGKLMKYGGITISFYYYNNDDGERKRKPTQILKERISSGSYGEVYLLKDVEGENIKIALKEFRKDVDPEMEVLKKLEEHGVNCNIMKARLLELIDEKNELKPKLVTVNELFNGTLEDLYSLEEDAFSSSVALSDRTHLQISTKIDMFQQLVEDLYCLAKKEFYYTDLKAENVLYKCVGNGKFRVAFGDLGSICHEDIKSNATFTYYPPEVHEVFNLCSKTSIVWGLGILLLELVFLGNYEEGYRYKLLGNLYWGEAGAVTFPFEKYEKLMKEIDKLSKGDIIGESLQFKFSSDRENRETTVLDLIKSMLTIEPTKRITLEDIRKLLHKSRFAVFEVDEPTPAKKSRFEVTQVIEPTPTESRFKVTKVVEVDEPRKPTQTRKSNSNKSSRKTIKKKNSRNISKKSNIYLKKTTIKTKTKPKKKWHD